MARTVELDPGGAARGVVALAWVTHMSVLRWLFHRHQPQPVPPAVLLAKRRPQTLVEVAELERERAAILARVAELQQDAELDQMKGRRRVDLA